MVTRWTKAVNEIKDGRIQQCGLVDRICVNKDIHGKEITGSVKYNIIANHIDRYVNHYYVADTHKTSENQCVLWFI